MRKIWLVAVLLLGSILAHATDTLTIRDNGSGLLTKRFFTQIADPSGNMTIEEAMASGGFHHNGPSLPYIKYTDSVIWVRFILHNKTIEPYLPVTINYGIIDGFDLYDVGNRGSHIIHLGSTDIRDNKNNTKQIGRVINCPVLPDSVCTIYLRIKSNDAMAIPIKIQSANVYLQASVVENLTFGFFIGIVVIMVLYNFLLYILVKDVSYLYYTFYILFLGLSQWESHGLGSTIFPVSKMLLNNYIIPLTRVFFWYAILLFVREFLQLNENILKKYNRYYYLLYILVSLPVIAILFKQNTLTYSLITVIFRFFQQFGVGRVFSQLAIIIHQVKYLQKIHSQRLYIGAYKINGVINFMRYTGG